MPVRSVRERILETASELFYAEGVHAVGVDTIIERAEVAKSSLYRYFRTKDDLIAAYVESEDVAFWARWDAVAAEHAGDPRAALVAVLNWIGTKIAAPGYRGCPQQHVAAEFPDPGHPARLVAARHKEEMRRRLVELAMPLDPERADVVADQLWLLIDGAFANHDLIADRDPVALLEGAAAAILPPARARRKPTRATAAGTDGARSFS